MFTAPLELVLLVLLVLLLLLVNKQLESGREETPTVGIRSGLHSIVSPVALSEC